MRKCHNPRLAGKSTANHENNSKIVATSCTPTTVTLTTTTTTTTTTVPPTKEPIRKVKVVSGRVLQEEKLPEPDNDTAAKLIQQDKGVFIPRQMTRIQPDLKVNYTLICSCKITALLIFGCVFCCSLILLCTRWRWSSLASVQNYNFT